MTKSLGIWLIIYGVMMDFLGTLGALYNPATNTVGFNPAAISALMAGGGCAAFSILWGVLILRGQDWAVAAAKVTTILFAIAFGGRMAMAWAALARGAGEKWYAATLLTLMTVGSILMVVRLFSTKKTGDS